MKNTPGQVWNADFVIDTQVVSNLVDDEARFRRVAALVGRMTEKPEFGSGWLAMSSFLELLAAGDSAHRIRLVACLLRLIREAQGRLKVLAPLPMLVNSEWSGREPLHWTPAHLDEVLSEAVEGGTTEGSILSAARDEFLAWKLAHREQFLEQLKERRVLFRSRPEFGADIERALSAWHAPQAYLECDDIARRLVGGDVGLSEAAFGPAVQAPQKYLHTWTFALLVRLAQFAASIPRDVIRERWAGLAGVLEPDKNDLTDANIAASAANCGILITEDQGLMARVNFLYANNLVRLQAFGVDLLDRQWRPPGFKA